MIDDTYIRAIVKESTSIPEKQKKRILERFTKKQLLFENNKYCCPHCKMPTPKISNYCCNCGQMVTLEKPTIIKFSKDECDKEFSDQKLIMSDEKCNKCEYLYLCPYMAQAMDEVVYGC